MLADVFSDEFSDDFGTLVDQPGGPSDIYTDIWTDYYGIGIPPTGPTDPDPGPIIVLPPPRPQMSWVPRVRLGNLLLADPLLFEDLVLIERYGQPDTLSITGHIDDLRPAFQAGTGIVLVDDMGVQRFSGVAPQFPKVFVERRGDHSATINYDSDLVYLWERSCYPSPTRAFTSQTAGYDVQTGVQEDRIVGYIERNAGASAYHLGTFDRRVPSLSIPASQGRGTSAKTSGRFQNLGELVARMAEQANLRVTIRHDVLAGLLRVTIDEVPDLSRWARFGDAGSGDLGLLGEDWRYAVGAPGATVVLSAAKGQLENRALNVLEDNTRKTAWGRHIEFFVDQRGTDDSSEIAAGMKAAMDENAPTMEAAAPIAAGDLDFGPGEGSIPIGAKVAVNLDGEVVVDRVRQVTTTVSVTPGEPTVKVEPLFGSPDAAIPISEKALRRALSRLRNLERTQ